MLKNSSYSISLNKNKYIFIKSINDFNKYKNQHNILVYSGLCKTKINMDYVLNNDINHVLVYNMREIPMMENMNINYLIKLKCDSNDIGFDYSKLNKIINNKPISNKLIGFYLCVKKNLISNVEEYSFLMFNEIRNKILSLLNNIKNTNNKLKLVLDIYNLNNKLDNHNKFNILFKSYMNKYFKNHNKYSNYIII